MPTSPTRRSDTSQLFESLFDAHFQEIYRYCVRRLGSADAEDAAADVFAVAWRRLDDLPVVEARRAWLYGVAYRVVANRFRTRRRQLGLMRRLAETRAGETGDPVSADSDLAIRAALAKLARSDQELLRLSSWDGLTRGEIAYVLGIKENAVDQRLHRARSRLRDKYQRLDHRSDHTGAETRQISPKETTP